MNAYDDTDDALIVALASGSSCSLGTTPEKDNWVDQGGGLPPYICKIARAVKRSGKSTSSSIAIAVSRVKKWAAGADGVDVDTKAKASKAVTQWEAMKAKAKAKRVVKASSLAGESYVMLTAIGSFNTEVVRDAFYGYVRTDGPVAIGYDAGVTIPEAYITELWTDHIIAELGYGSDRRFMRIPYTVAGLTVSFGEPTPVERSWTEVTEPDELTELEIELLEDLLDSGD